MQRKPTHPRQSRLSLPSAEKALVQSTCLEHVSGVLEYVSEALSQAGQGPITFFFFLPMNPRLQQCSATPPTLLLSNDISRLLVILALRVICQVTQRRSISISLDCLCNFNSEIFCPMTLFRFVEQFQDMILH